MAYVAFDLLWLDGRDVRDLPLIERKRRLTRLIGDQTGSVMRSLVVEACGGELFEAVCRLDLEGIVAKRKADPYEEQTRWDK